MSIRSGSGNREISGSVAEPVEPRPGTKGNAEQQSTLRTQGRERVTQALGRARLAARQRKKEQFTALLHHINVDTLREREPGDLRIGHWPCWDRMVRSGKVRNRSR